MIRALSFVLFVSVTAGVALPPTEGGGPEPDRDLLALVRCGTDRGSAVGVRDDGDTTLMATCWHVVQSGNAVKVRVPHRTLDAKVVARDEANDVALLRVSGRVPVAPLAEAAPKEGDPLTMIGGASLVSAGKVTGLEDANGRPTADADFDGYSGDSGGGVFLRGRLIGVVRGVRRDNGHARVSLGVRELLKTVPVPPGAAARKTTPTEGK